MPDRPSNTPKLKDKDRAEALASLKRYADENFPEPLGDLPATLLLDFLLEEIGPVIYNAAIADAQARLQSRLADLAGELYSPEFTYWPRVDARRKRR